MNRIACAVALVLSGVACSGREPEAGSSTATVMLTGDVMLGRGVDQILRHSVDPFIYGPYLRPITSARDYVALAETRSGAIPRAAPPEYVWGDALSLLDRQAPDLRIVNLETAVTAAGEPWPDKPIRYRMHPANVDVLQAAKIDAAILANNHALDWGRPSLLETLSSLTTAGIRTAGAGSDSVGAATPAIISVPDGRVLVFGMADRSSGVPADWSALPDRPGVQFLPDLSRKTALTMARLIARHPRQPGDRVLVSIHWGPNWSYEVPVEQRRFARTLIAAGGVDLVHGHSSHHPKGLEVYRGRLILYGAGDLINDYEGIGGREEFRPELSLIYLARLERSGALRTLLLLPLKRARFRLNRTTPGETGWLLGLLRDRSRGLRFELTGGPDSLLIGYPVR